MPDLVVEVDITSPSLEMLPTYSRLGIREVWRYDGGRLVVLLLDDASYIAVPESAILPGATGDALTRLVAEGLALDCRVWRRRVREAVQGLQ